jgi:hypothetical protein
MSITMNNVRLLIDTIQVVCTSIRITFATPGDILDGTDKYNKAHYNRPTRITASLRVPDVVLDGNTNDSETVSKMLAQLALSHTEFNMTVQPTEVNVSGWGYGTVVFEDCRISQVAPGGLTPNEIPQSNIELTALRVQIGGKTYGDA